MANFFKDFEKKVFDSLLCTVDGAGDACGERRCIGVGVSGGADSICLLVCLANLFKKCPSVSLKVVTVNHNIRSEKESGGDCNFVVSVCNKLNELFFQKSEEKKSLL